MLDNTTALDAAVNDFEPGPVAIISQSGNVAIDIARHLSDLGLGVSRFASLGNCADLDVADLVDSCVDHDGTFIIAVYCEGFRDGRKFARAAARASRIGKPVLLLSVGRSAASTRGAASHTGSLVTAEVVVRAVCEATGAAFVASPLEMANLVQALLRTRIPVGRRVGVLSDGGGHASLTSDALMDAGLHVEDFSAQLRSAVAAEVGPRASVSNPIDLAGEGERDITCFTRVAERLVDAPEVDAVVMTGFFGGYTGYNPAIADDEVQVGRDIAALVNGTGATFVVQTAYADSAPARALRAGGVAVYRDVEHAAWALGRVVERSLSVPQRLAPTPAPATPLTETGYWAARPVLASAGVPFVAAAEVSTFDELERAVLHLRYPLVLKALGDEHKSDNGGVTLNIRDNAGLVGAWQDVQTRLAPPVCSIEEMAEVGNAVELIVGVRRDPAFGPVVLVGIGGVYAELLKDTRCALGPVTPQSARDLLLSLRGSSLLTGFRGRAAVDLDSAAELVSTLSRYAAAHPEIAELECNPIAVTPHGALALDARIVLEEAITCLR